MPYTTWPHVVNVVIDLIEPRRSTYLLLFLLLDEHSGLSRRQWLVGVGVGSIADRDDVTYHKCASCSRTSRHKLTYPVLRDVRIQYVP